MFKSKRRPIVIPQSEHLKLVGALSTLWGNTDFDRPPIENKSMIAGMSLHDRGYALLDSFPIGGMGDEEWNGIARHSFSMFNSDIVADTIVKYHVRRLAAYSDSNERKTMTAEFSAAIDQQLSENNLSKELFGRIDRITNLTDSISFDFCFDEPDSGSVSIFPRNKQDTEVTVQ